MSELFFVLKCLIFTVLLIVLMQVKVGGSTMEDHAQVWLKKSSISTYIQSVAAGGALALKNLTQSAKDALSGSSDHFYRHSRDQAGK